MGRAAHRPARLLIGACAAVLIAAALSACGPAGYRWISQRYVVRSGDTLYSIAFSHDLDFHDVARWNHIRPPYTIYPGETLRLTPPPNLATATQPAPQAAPAPQSAPSPQSAHGQGTPPVAANAPAPSASNQGASAAKPSKDHAGVIHWRWPVRGRLVKTPDSPIAPKGINIGGHVGEPVRATAPGKVVYSGNGLKGYGRLIIVKHSIRYLSAYGDNSKLEVREGEHVRRGQIIARMGLGPGQKPMLHFEIRRDGKPVNPLDFLPSHK